MASADALSTSLFQDNVFFSPFTSKRHLRRIEGNYYGEYSTAKKVGIEVSKAINRYLKS